MSFCPDLKNRGEWIEREKLPEWANVAGKAFKTDEGEIGFQGGLNQPDGIITHWFFEDKRQGIDHDRKLK